MVKCLQESSVGSDVTVVIPCYNAELWVGRAIKSVLDQQGVTVEVIVVDDGSTDGSLEVIQSFGDRIRWETGPNRGACAARNRGLELATARYALFLDADDYLEHPFLRDGNAAMRDAHAAVGVGPYAVEWNGSRELFVPPPLRAHYDVLRFVIYYRFIGPCSIIWDAAFLRQLGGWSLTTRKRQDHELFIRAIGYRPEVNSWQGGAGVYFNHCSGERISDRFDECTVESEIAVIHGYRRHLERAGLSDYEINEIILHLAYMLWRRTARRGNMKVERLTREFWRDQGGKLHTGSLFHITFSTVFGLRTKERLASWLARQRRRGTQARISSDWAARW